MNKEKGTGKWRTFEQAREFVHSLGLKSSTEWSKYSKSGEKPKDIPADPGQAYKEEWKGFGDWLGTGIVATQDRKYRSFEEARKFARKLGLKGNPEWKNYYTSGKKPADIPTNPDTVYKDQGWTNGGDFLATGNVDTHNKPWRSFKKAREFVHSLKLKGDRDWRNYCNSGKRPDDIPTDPSEIYKNEGWINSADWLGTRNIAPSKMKFRPFAEAREFARSLGLKDYNEWKKYCKSGKKPADIHSNPNTKYKGKGWIDYYDWLGFEETSWSITRVKELLKGLIDSGMIYQMSEVRLYLEFKRSFEFTW